MSVSREGRYWGGGDSLVSHTEDGGEGHKYWNLPCMLPVESFVQNLALPFRCVSWRPRPAGHRVPARTWPAARGGGATRGSCTTGRRWRTRLHFWKESYSELFAGLPKVLIAVESHMHVCTHLLAEEAPHIDEALVAQVADMGFALEGCRKAVYHTKNSGLEAAMNWVMEHMEDPGIVGFFLTLFSPSKSLHFFAF